MTNNENITMLVCWKQQRRLINLKSEDNLDTIAKSIIDSFHLQQLNKFYEYQIQYYDQNYQTFVDLYSETIHIFQQLVQRLLSPDAPSKKEKIWCLQIIPKQIETTCHTSDDTLTVDTCNYQPDKNTHESMSEINNQMDDSTSSSNSINTEDVNKTATSQIDNEGQHKTIESESLQQINTLNCVSTNLNNPLDLHFQDDIASCQRKQYESEMNRKTNSNSSSIGGVFLRALNFNDSIPYPTLHFQIPKTKLDSSWSLYIYILTECDSNGKYYLHASKGIYDNITMIEDRFGRISNSNLVNPYVIELSQNDIQQGKYEIRLRVCNIRNLSIHKHEKLREFPEVNRFMIYDDDNLISMFTSTDLNFSSDKYHIGCILVCDYTAQDRCISKLTIDDNKRKQKDDKTKIKKNKI